jgi:hypothetical protein
MSTHSDPGTDRTHHHCETDLWSNIMSENDQSTIMSDNDRTSTVVGKHHRMRKHRTRHTPSYEKEATVNDGDVETAADDNNGDVQDANPREVEGTPEIEIEDEEAVSGDCMLDTLMRCFPVPGEVWVHLLGRMNYMSSILDSYPPPQPGGTPCIINGWDPHGAVETSPYRIQYGTQNPMMRGMIITPTTLIPHFSWTPHLAMEEITMETMVAQYEPDGDLLILPAVHGQMVRIFQYDGLWYIANSHVVERIMPNARASGSLTQLMSICIAPHRKGGLGQFLRDLDHSRIWFFALYGSLHTLLFIGTCRYVTHHEVRSNILDHMYLNLDFSLHRYLPPSVPLLPVGLFDIPLIHTLVNPLTMRYTGLYNGLLVLNPVTMFAIRITPPTIVYLMPLLNHKQSLIEFLAARSIEWLLMDISRPSIDHTTFDWFKYTVREFTVLLFGERHCMLLNRIEWQIQNILHWLPVWVAYIKHITRDEWNRLDIDIQRIHSLLEYEPCSAWYHIICNPKYTTGMAKVVMFCIEQWEGVCTP